MSKRRRERSLAGIALALLALVAELAGRSLTHRIDIDASVRIRCNNRDFNTRCFQMAQRPHHGIVFEARRDDVIAGFEKSV